MDETGQKYMIKIDLLNVRKIKKMAKYKLKIFTQIPFVVRVLPLDKMSFIFLSYAKLKF